MYDEQISICGMIYTNNDKYVDINGIVMTRCQLVWWFGFQSFDKILWDNGHSKYVLLYSMGILTSIAFQPCICSLHHPWGFVLNELPNLQNKPSKDVGSGVNPSTPLPLPKPSWEATYSTMANLALLLNAYWDLRSKGIPATISSTSNKGGMRTTLVTRNPSPGSEKIKCGCTRKFFSQKWLRECVFFILFCNILTQIWVCTYHWSPKNHF